MTGGVFGPPVSASHLRNSQSGAVVNDDPPGTFTGKLTVTDDEGCSTERIFIGKACATVVVGDDDAGGRRSGAAYSSCARIRLARS